ncbi:MAG: hypothetical protein KDC18_12680 [Alphaproteobacteria bacterium]|nr:hypothetical protein [Alphaproteobacteria bacterium]
MLFDLYNQLCEHRPRGEGEIFGLPVCSKGTLWLCVDVENQPALLLPAKPDDTRPDIILRAIDVQFSRWCMIKRPTGVLHEACYTIIRLKEADPDIARLFLRILERFRF